jgi:predicted RNA-binding protein YlxR (DUF448 family)
MQKKIIFRKCQGCWAIFDRENMLKITRDYKSTQLYINPNSNIVGRSVYVCKNDKCIKMLLKKRRIEKNFAGKTLSYEELRANLEDKPHQ